MNYELAKKLFKAGFDRKSVPRDFQPFGQPLTDEEYTNSLQLTELSELIEACGDRFMRLVLYYDQKGNRTIWEATAMGESFIMDNGRKGKTKHTRGNGSTPEEAVANLWLDLNKK